MGPKVGVFVCQLESNCRKDEMEVATVFEVSRTKEGCTQETISERTFSNGLGDRRLPCPGEAVQPEDGGLVEVFRPRLDLAQDSFPRAPEAASTISMLICSSTSTAVGVQYG